VGCGRAQGACECQTRKDDECDAKASGRSHDAVNQGTLPSLSEGRGSRPGCGKDCQNGMSPAFPVGMKLEGIGFGMMMREGGGKWTRRGRVR